jgi:hypothetical protein
MLIIDISCLRGSDGELVIKELALLGSNTKACWKTVQTYMFSPPYPEYQILEHIKKSNAWATEHSHNICWNDGIIPYSKLPWILQDSLLHHKTIYTKGSEKSVILSQMTGRNVIDLTTMGCPKADQLITPRLITCSFLHREQCSLYKCHKYADWLQSQGYPKLKPENNMVSDEYHDSDDTDR